MRHRTVLIILLCLSAAVFLPGEGKAAQAQGAAPFPACIPAAPSEAQAGARGPAAPQQAQPARGAAAQRIPRDVAVTEIPGVVGAGAKWIKVWQAAGNSADG